MSAVPADEHTVDGMAEPLAACLGCGFHLAVEVQRRPRVIEIDIIAQPGPDLRFVELLD